MGFRDIPVPAGFRGKLPQQFSLPVGQPGRDDHPDFNHLITAALAAQ